MFATQKYLPGTTGPDIHITTSFRRTSEKITIIITRFLRFPNCKIILEPPDRFHHNLRGFITEES